jgi:predicted Zn-dependent protease
MPNRLEMLLEFSRSKPDEPFPQYGLAIEYKNLGRLDDAARTFAELLARHPGYTAAYLHAGNVLLELGRKTDARATYEAGIAACRQKGDAHALGELQAALDAL